MYVPCFKGPIEGYVVNQLSRHHWRIASTHTREDAMQEAWVVFLKCAKKYPNMDTPQHFMALFMVSWTNHMNDLSTKATKLRAEVGVEEDEGVMLPSALEVTGELDNEGLLRVMIRQAPKEVLMVLSLFLNAPQELLDLAMKSWTAQGRNSAGGRRHINRMLGIQADADLLQMTEDYFTNQKR